MSSNPNKLDKPYTIPEELKANWDEWISYLKEGNPFYFKYTKDEELSSNLAVYYRHLYEFYLSGGSPDKFWKTHSRVVIYQNNLGIFLGECMGLSFWSKLDDADQPSAVTMDNPGVENYFIKTFSNPQEYRVIPILNTDLKGIYIPKEKIIHLW